MPPRPNLLVLSVILLAGVGCAPEPPASWEGSRTRQGLRAALDPLLGDAAPVPLRRADPSCDEVRRLLPQFRQNLTRQPPPAGVLDTMSGCLERSGELLVLAELLAAGVAAHPGELALQHRLVATLVQLGDEDEARRRLLPARQQAPDAPEGLFLEGLLQRRTGDQAGLERTRAAWTRLLEIAPTHRGMGRIPPETIRRELAEIERRLGTSTSTSTDTSTSADTSTSTNTSTGTRGSEQQASGEQR